MYVVQLAPRSSPSVTAVGLDKMKIATRRYARYQTKWIRKRMFEQRNPELAPPVYSFDSTDASNFLENVIKPAVAVIGK